MSQLVDYDFIIVAVDRMAHVNLYTTLERNGLISGAKVTDMLFLTTQLNLISSL